MPVTAWYHNFQSGPLLRSSQAEGTASQKLVILPDPEWAVPQAVAREVQGEVASRLPDGPAEEKAAE